MPMHSVMLVTVRAHPPRAINPENLVRVDDSKGVDLLRVFTDLVTESRQNATMLSDAQSRRLDTVLDCAMQGQWIHLTVDDGMWGLPFNVRASDTGKVIETHGPRNASTSAMRVMLAVPPGGVAGFLAFERVGNRSLRKPIGRAFLSALKARYPNLVFEFETVTWADDWLEAANLDRVTATYFDFSSDASDAVGGRVAGELVAVLKPAIGKSQLFAGLRAKDVKAGRLLGISENYGEPDEVKVELSAADGTKKSFVLGKERTPMVTTFLSEGFPPPDDEEFRRVAFDLIADHAKRICGVAWAGTMEHDQPAVT